MVKLKINEVNALHVFKTMSGSLALKATLRNVAPIDDTCNTCPKITVGTWAPEIKCKWIVNCFPKLVFDVAGGRVSEVETIGDAIG